jgi:hypothetical protein
MQKVAVVADGRGPTLGEKAEIVLAAEPPFLKFETIKIIFAHTELGFISIITPFSEP